MAIKYKITECYKKYFNISYINCLEDLLKKCDFFSLIINEKDRQIFEIEINNKVFFLKISKKERFRKITRSILKKLSYQNPIKKEYNNLLYLSSNNISVAKLAIWGDQVVWGLPIHSFMVTERVNGQDFITLYNSLDKKNRIRLFKSYANLIGNLHINSIDSPARVQDIICMNNKGSFKLTLIDREIGSKNRIIFTLPRASKEFSKIYYEGIKRYNTQPTIKEQISFCRHYLEINKNISLSFKDFYKKLNHDISKYIKTRKSSFKVQQYI